MLTDTCHAVTDCNARKPVATIEGIVRNYFYIISYIYCCKIRTTFEYRRIIRTSTCACGCVPIDCRKTAATLEGIRADARHAVRNSYTGQRTAILKGVAFYSRHRFCIKIDVRNFKICSVKSSNSNNGIAFAILVQFKSKSSLKISAGVAYSGFIKIMPCGYFNIGCIITTRTCVVCLPPDFRTCRCFCLMMYYSMLKRFTIFITTSFASSLFDACCGSAMAVFRFGMFAVVRTDSCMSVCAFIFFPFSEVVSIWIYCNRQIGKRCFRFEFIILKHFVTNRAFVMRFRARCRASRLYL